ncbi:MAG: tRNA (N(6)-L-threonylcarbamoyladenosine(37)-C(2))-methylthiotransferase MtaB [Chloroflexota bacterium]
MRVAVYTLGCKLNQAESEDLCDRLEQQGFDVVSPLEAADVYLANTCTVTHVADRKARHWLRLQRRRHPEAFLVASGCYVERATADLRELADLLVGNRHKHHLPGLLNSLAGEGAGPVAEAREREQGVGARAAGRADGNRRVRSLVKIQDGCEGSCSYCIVPEVRPWETSVSPDTVLDQVRRRTESGYREVVLTGTRVGSYSYDGLGLRELLMRVLAETDVERLRLSSLQPREVTDALLQLWQDRRVCRHLHLSLQSGSDGVLRRMRRGYTVDKYRRTLELIRRRVPDVAVTTDLIVGFPGETEDDFEESLRTCEEFGFSRVHVFPYSARPGTAAAGMEPQVDEKTKRWRVQRALDLAERAARHYRERFVGQIMPVLWEAETAPGRGIYSGLTDNYLRVEARSDVPMTNTIAPAKVCGSRDSTLYGELVHET